MKKRMTPMRVATGIFGLCLLAAVGIFIYGALWPSAEERARTAEIQKVTYRQKEADTFAEKRYYIKDPTTGLCFALLPAPRTDENAAFASVPCEAVPAELLVIGHPSK